MPTYYIDRGTATKTVPPKPQSVVDISRQPLQAMLEDKRKEQQRKDRNSRITQWQQTQRKRFPIIVRPEMATLIDEAAAAAGMSRNAWIVGLIDDALGHPDY